MSLTYMTHPYHGAMHAGDFGEIERLKTHGWSVAKEPTADEIRASKMPAALEPVITTPITTSVITSTVEKKKPGRKPKVA